MFASLIGVLTFVVSMLLPSSASADEFDIVVVEAEDFLIANSPWESTSAEGSEGSPANVLAPREGAHPPGIDGLAAAHYLVEFPRAGLYAFHALTRGLDAAGAPSSVLYVGIDQTWRVASFAAGDCAGSSGWGWTGLGDEAATDCQNEADAPYVYVDRPGIHRVRIGSAAADLAIDRFVLVHDRVGDGASCRLQAGGGVECRPANIRGDGRASLVASFSETIAEARVDEVIEFDIRVDNTDAVDIASDVTLKLSFEDGLAFRGQRGCDCRFSGGTLSCGFEKLRAGAARSCQVVALAEKAGVLGTDLNVLESGAEHQGGVRHELNVAPRAAGPMSPSSASTEQARMKTGATRTKAGGTGCVGNLVWLDTNGDGIKTADEPGMPNSTLELRDLSGKVVDTDTASNGYFELCAAKGDYLVQLEVPAGYQPTVANRGNDDYHDSDAGADGRISVGVREGRRNGRFDIGLVEAVGDVATPTTSRSVPQEQARLVSRSADRRGCVGNLVWRDDNEDGRRQSVEPGLPAIAVSLHEPGGRLVDSKVTSNGYFMLCGAGGPHEMRVAVPTDMRVTARDRGGEDYYDSDAASDGKVMVEVLAGRSTQRFDVGLVPIGDSVDGDGDSGGGNDGGDDRDGDDSGGVGSIANASSVLASTASSDGTARKASRPARSGEVLFGPWVQPEDVLSRNVFGRFNAALVQWSRPDNIVSLIEDARRKGTRIFVQLGTQGDWGYNVKSKASQFTVEKWKRTVDRFGKNPAIKRAMDKAIADGTIRGIYLIDEPHHERWSPSGRSHKHISNADIDEMAAHVKRYWPNARTSVRSSPRTLFGYGRDQIEWRHLDEAFVMIQYRKWMKHGREKTIEAFMERELKDAHDQGLDVIGSIQMLIGAPTSNREFWPSGSGMRPVGRLKVSPIELERYVEAFLKRRDREGRIDPQGQYQVRDVMVFRWSRNKENDWSNRYYDEAIDDLIGWTARQ